MLSRIQAVQLVRAAMIAVAVSFTWAVTPVLAQQRSDSVQAEQRSGAFTHAPSTTQTGPRLSPQLQRVEPSLKSAKVSGSAAMGIEGGNHTIVFSTLALVLAVIIVVLLVN